jgi:hypothetical protein
MRVAENLSADGADSCQSDPPTQCRWIAGQIQMISLISGEVVIFQESFTVTVKY